MKEAQVRLEISGERLEYLIHGLIAFEKHIGRVT
tara:strand:+ start:2365 stop:2466 length:102 start_codon:yes stop_codon:yes gene_type:complete